MSNLKIGDVVWHQGQKKKITYVRKIFGGAFYHLAGFPYMTPRTRIKPVIRLTEEVRFSMRVQYTKEMRAKNPFWRSTMFVDGSKVYAGDAPHA